MRKVRTGVISVVATCFLALLQTPSAQANLFTFTSHTFTTCTATGATGPTYANCTSAYSGASWATNYSYFSTSSGIQLWTVPRTATYRITAYGARGGNGSNGGTLGGQGAKAQGDVSLTQGTQIKILVGQAGSDGSSTSAGGGGGSFVTTSTNSPLIVAGGGGGGAGPNSTGTKSGKDASISTSGSAGYDGVASGGTGGAGGASPGGAWSGASGGGLTGDGGPGREYSADISGSGGKSFTNGGGGGAKGNLYGSFGGFGGGGGATWGAGGGGGYSGGGADHSTGSGTDREGAGGGGSFASGANQQLVAAQSNGAGSVTIQILTGAPDAPTIGTASALSPVSATITFSAPGNNNGDTITGYTAITTPESRTATLSQAGSGTITITGLSPNTSYVIRVYATNSLGNSALSSPSNSITTPIATTSISIALPANSTTATYRTQTTITATVVGAEGKVTFFLNSKRIPNCIGRPTSSRVATCSWKPAIHGSANVRATFLPTSNDYYSSTTSNTFSVVRRTGQR